ncbi:MAG: C-GCAxxG-C-C family (seleno)protein [Sarcina sp.]
MRLWIVLIVGHQSPKTRELTAMFMEKFYEKLGAYKCTELKEKYRFNDERRCLIMIETAAEALEEIIG